MATVLGDGQFEIDGLTFGGVWDQVKIDSVEPPQVSIDAQRTDNAFRPGVFMGRDLLRPGDWQFNLRTDAYTVDDARDAANELGARWLYGGHRPPGALSTMRYRMGDVTRRVYGRGMEFNHNFDKWTYSGASPIVCSFQMVSPFSYGDDERSVIVGRTPPVTGGLVAPLQAPLEAVGTGESMAGGFIEDVGGTAPASPVFDLHGPCDNVMIKGDTWSIEYVGNVAPDQVITIDCRFGMTKVYDNFGRILNDHLSWRTNLSRVMLTPGTENIRYESFDLTNLSYAVVRWRPAYHTF